MNRHRRTTFADGRGATLLELIVYIGVIGLILTSVTLFALEFVNAQAKQAAYSEVSRDGQYALARIGVEVREATDLNIGASTFGANPGVLSLAKTPGSINPTVFALTNGALTIQQGAGAATPLTSSKVEVTEFIVDNVGTVGRTRAVRIRLKLKNKNPDSWQQIQAEATFETTAKVQKNDGFGP